MGGVSFYKTAQDGFLARQKGGVNGDRIKNSPEFARTRENGSEFGRAGEAGKVLRTAFRALIVNTADSRMASRLTGEMVKVIKADATNVRGERNVIDGETELLRGFEFNERGKLNRTFFAPFTTTINRQTGMLQVEIPAFVPGNMIAAPQGATHVRLVAGGAVVDFENEDYNVITTATEELPVNGAAQLPLQTLTTLVGPGGVRPMFLVFGVEFYQLVNGQQYSLKNGAYNALTLVAVDGGGA